MYRQWQGRQAWRAESKRLREAACPSRRWAGWAEGHAWDAKQRWLIRVYVRADWHTGVTQHTRAQSSHQPLKLQAWGSASGREFILRLKNTMCAARPLMSSSSTLNRSTVIDLKQNLLQSTKVINEQVSYYCEPITKATWCLCLETVDPWHHTVQHYQYLLLIACSTWQDLWNDSMSSVCSEHLERIKI